jgi:hypothetical protein
VEFVLSGGRDDGAVDSAGAASAVDAGDIPAGFTEIIKAAAMDKTQPITKRMFHVRVILLHEY